MSSRREEERNEKIIRGLMKLPPNRRCINCNSLGPQYVCTNFWTFVCMTCSGIHREFTHRVKSVSMSKFTSQEVEALQEGGNQRARETFLRDWDPREQRLPDNSNVDKVRAFIKSVYVDKKFFASKASGKPPRDTMINRNHEDETRRASSYHSYSQSPPYDYQYEERRYGKQAPALTKKPGSDRGMFRFMSTSRLSDHVQEDSFANEVTNARASDYSVTNGGDLFRSGTQSPPLSQSSGSGKFDGLDLFGAQNPPQSNTPAPSNQTVKFDGLDLFSAPNPPQSTTSTPSEPEKFGGLDLFSAPNPPQSTTSAPSEPEKFGGLDLFSAPHAPQSTLSAPTSIDLFELSAPSAATTLSTNQFKAFESPLDLFTVMPQQHQSTDTLDNNPTDTVTQNDGGWATFDMPLLAEPSQGTKSSVVSETSTSDASLGKLDRAVSLDKSSHLPYQQEFSASGPSLFVHSSWHDTGAPVNVQNNQSWSSFEESTTHFDGSYMKGSEQVPVQVTQVADPYLAWGISENFQINQADWDTRPPSFLNTTPHALGSLNSSSQLPVMGGAQSRVLESKSSNPFDFPDDADLESSNMFLDMSSLQSALPNHNMSTSWYPESASGISQDALAFMTGPVPNVQIP
ncbi:probable ADP-ribosylation factor GTPase-activating protein AGD14 [Rutidosis leptorrhynchoides]|uniref:probable ADP-ribosylation factor GTPase-activating protein AGD14 n=1 Tax=Rutidosis leptorrhynchoides TaxID=125765 RepID=UPI003A98F1D9